MPVHLRAMTEADLPTLFELQRDPDSNRQAAFIARDPNDEAAFMEHWRTKVLGDPTVLAKAVLVDDQVAGWVAHFLRDGKPEVAYWIGTPWRGRGVATIALTALLGEVPARPLHASAAADNIPSIRVLQKCGFHVIHTAPAFASARGHDIDEVFLELR